MLAMRSERPVTGHSTLAMTETTANSAPKLDAFSLAQLREFFELLDRWEREGADGRQVV